MIVCPLCDAETSSEYNFCINCDCQIQCLNDTCGRKLIPGKTFCLGCGQPLAKTSAIQTQPNRYIRNIKQSGKTYEEHTEFSLSDHAVGEIAPFVVGQIMASPLQSSHPKSPRAPVPIKQPLVNLNDALPELESSRLPEALDLQPRELQGVGAAQYFVRDGEYLVVEVKDFKGSTWAEQQKRFILLYASAYYQSFGQPVPDKEHFKKAAEKASIFDSSNFTKYLGEAIRTYLSEIGGGFKLNKDGEKEVGSILAKIEDENVGAGNKYWERSTGAVGKRQVRNKDDKARIEDWAQEDVALGSLDVRDLQRGRDYALVSLWILTVCLKKAEAIRWIDA
jgi:hypothetical protein